MKIIYEYNSSFKERMKHFIEYLLNKLPLVIGFSLLMQGNNFGYVLFFIGLFEYDFKVKKGKQKVLLKVFE